MLKALTLGSLSDLDLGRPQVAFEAELANAVRDCIDRPGDRAARKVTMTMHLTPIVDDDGDCDEVDVTFVFKTSVPNKQTKPYQMAINKQGRLFFSENHPEDLDQSTIDDIGPDGRVVRKPR